MRVLEPYTVTILTTSKCTASCRHCCMSSSPERSEMLTYDQMEMILLQLFEEVELKVVVFAGGEPTLLGDDLLRAIRLCKDHGIKTRIVTNGYWAHSPEAARQKLLELRAAGLDELNLSTDDYHLPYISLATVKNAYEAALAIDFRAVVVANAYGPQSHVTPELIKRELGGGEEMQMRYDESGCGREYSRKRGTQLVVLSNAHVSRIGRGGCGVKQSELNEPHTSLEELAQKVGGCPWAVRSAAISAKGHLVSCCGFELEDNPILDYGDLNEQPLKELLDKADNDLLTNMIALVGPVKIAQILREVCPDEVEFRRDCTSYCEACEDLVTIGKNRDAMYKYMGAFAQVILRIRDTLEEEFTRDGRVRLPPMHGVVVDMKKRESSPPPETRPAAPWGPGGGDSVSAHVPREES